MIRQAASPSYRFAFVMVTSLFFMWGFAHNLDPILIPHLKKSFSLSIVQSSLVDSAVFIAYFAMALPAGFLIKKYGYKKVIIVGLLFFATGCFLFIPAANTQQYVFFLMALFIIACGLTILETSANPYATLLGHADSATQRLNFAQSFNGLAASLAPIIGARLILTKDFTDHELHGMTSAAQKIALASEASTVKIPYLILGTVLIVIALIFHALDLPELKGKQVDEKGSINAALKNDRLRWAIAAQFFYVGAQVCVFSFFILYGVKAAGIDKVKAADYLGWGCGMAFMIGRFAGTFIMKFVAPSRLLAIYAAINVCLSVICITASGLAAIYTVIAIAFFMSIMFPTIFSLGIKELGPNNASGSSLIIMSIVGGAILPPVFGLISDRTNNIQFGYLIPLLCFLVVLLFAIKCDRPVMHVATRTKFPRVAE
jgi:MFS transporter, FHS family, L-fucose permease